MKNPPKQPTLTTEDEIYARLGDLPKGTVKKRLINGRTYYYLQRREGKKVIHTYLGKTIPPDIAKQLRERETLRKRLARIREHDRKLAVKELKKLFG